jgi:hypothetical protein
VVHAGAYVAVTDELLERQKVVVSAVSAPPKYSLPRTTASAGSRSLLATPSCSLLPPSEGKWKQSNSVIHHCSRPPTTPQRLAEPSASELAWLKALRDVPIGDAV